MNAYRYRERTMGNIRQTFAGLWPNDDDLNLGESYVLSKTFRDLLENSLSPPTNIIASAQLDGVQGEYRYELYRVWDTSKPCLVYIMLNPSVANAYIDDPTIRICMGRAARLGYGSIRVVNLFAYKSTSPSYMLEQAERLGTSYVIGARNDTTIMCVLGRNDIKTVICAWGDYGKLADRGKAIRGMIQDFGYTPKVIKLTAKGNPCHPLRLSYDLPLLEWV